jgi:hypothetical protein
MTAQAMDYDEFETRDKYPYIIEVSGIKFNPFVSYAMLGVRALPHYYVTSPQREVTHACDTPS